MTTKVAKLSAKAAREIEVGDVVRHVYGIGTARVTRVEPDGDDHLRIYLSDGCYLALSPETPVETSGKARPFAIPRAFAALARRARMHPHRRWYMEKPFRCGDTLFATDRTILLWKPVPVASAPNRLAYELDADDSRDWTYVFGQLLRKAPSAPGTLALDDFDRAHSPPRNVVAALTSMNATDFTEPDADGFARFRLPDGSQGFVMTRGDA